MPEVSEVCIASQYLNTNFQNKNLYNLKILSGKYLNREIKGMSLLNDEHKIIRVDSKGKLLWFELSGGVNDKLNGVNIVIHFGLTGELSLNENKFSRVAFLIGKTKNNVLTLYFNDVRNFGNITIVNNINLQKELNKLAPDLLKEEYNTTTLQTWISDFLKVSNFRKNVKLGVLLMRQSKKDGIGSGIGNYLSSEIMYDAKLSPHRTVGSLTDKDVSNLCHSIKYITKLSYFNNKTGYMIIFDDFINEHKNGIINGKYPNYHPDIKPKANNEFSFKVYGRDTDDNGNVVKHDKTINKGRTTYWVPAVQL